MAKRVEGYHKPDNKLIKAVGSKIRYHRKRQGLTLEALGHISKVHYKYLQRIETGTINPSISVIYSIAKGLQIPLKNLFSDF